MRNTRIRSSYQVNTIGVDYLSTQGTIVSAAMALNYDDIIKWKYFRVTGPLCGEFTGPSEFPAQRPVTRGFDVFFDLRLNKRLSKQPRAGDSIRHRGHYDVNVILVLPEYSSC